MITINIEKAKLIWREKIAESRKAAFETNDIAIRDAQLSGDDAALQTAIARRDQLRALGERINSAKTIDELKAIVP